MPSHSSFIYKIIGIGVMFLCLLAASWLTFYAGAGYGKRQLLWQDVDGGWAGVSTVRFRTCSATVGVGFCF